MFFYRLPVSVFSAGMETDWNLLPWQPSPPRRLPPRPVWFLSPCDSEQTNMQTNIWKTKARTLTADATVKPLTRLRAPSSYSAIQSWHLRFSPDVTSAPRLFVFCVNVTTQRSAPQIHSCPPDLWNVCTKPLQEGEIIMQLKDMVMTCFYQQYAQFRHAWIEKSRLNGLAQLCQIIPSIIDVPKRPACICQTDDLNIKLLRV